MATSVVYPDIYFEFMHRKTGKYEYYTYAEFLNDYIPMDVCVIVIKTAILTYTSTFTKMALAFDTMPLGVKSLYSSLADDFHISINYSNNLPPSLKDYWVNCGMSTTGGVPKVNLRNLPHYLEYLYIERGIIKLKYPLRNLFITFSKECGHDYNYINVCELNILYGDDIHNYVSRKCTKITLMDVSELYINYLPNNLVQLTYAHNPEICVYHDNLPLIKKLSLYSHINNYRDIPVRNISEHTKIRIKLWHTLRDIYDEYYFPRMRRYVRD